MDFRGFLCFRVENLGLRVEILKMRFLKKGSMKNFKKYGKQTTRWYIFMGCRSWPWAKKKLILPQKPTVSPRKEEVDCHHDAVPLLKPTLIILRKRHYYHDLAGACRLMLEGCHPKSICRCSPAFVLGNKTKSSANARYTLQILSSSEVWHIVFGNFTFLIWALAT